MVTSTLGIRVVQEAAGVDLVLSAHSHSYERSWPLRGHYGVGSTLRQCNVLNSTIDGSYLKPLGMSANRGTVCVFWLRVLVAVAVAVGRHACCCCEAPKHIRYRMRPPSPCRLFSPQLCRCWVLGKELRHASHQAPGDGCVFSRVWVTSAGCGVGIQPRHHSILPHIQRDSPGHLSHRQGSQ